MTTTNPSCPGVRREFGETDFSHVEDKRLQLLLSHWLDSRGSNAVPFRSAIDPTAIAGALPSIWLCEFLLRKQRFRMRLAGEEINRFYGRNIGQSDFEEIAEERFLPTITKRYRRIIEEPAILHCAGHIYLANGRYVLGERVALPLRSSNGLILQIIGASVYDDRSLQYGFDVETESLQERFTPLFE